MAKNEFQERYVNMNPVNNGHSYKANKSKGGGPGLLMAVLIAIATFFVFVVVVEKATGKKCDINQILHPEFLSHIKGAHATAPIELENEAQAKESTFSKATAKIENIKDALPSISETGDKVMTEDDAFVKRYNISEDEWNNNYAKKPAVKEVNNHTQIKNETTVERLVINDGEEEKVWIAKQAKGVENDTTVYMSEKLAIKNTPNNRGEIVADLSYYGK